MLERAGVGTPQTGGGVRAPGREIQQLGRSAGPAPAGGGNDDAVRRAIQQSLGAAGSAGPSTGPTTNSAAPNPTSQSVIDAMLARAKGDMGAGAALDRGIQDIRARASMGIAKEQEASRAMRGMSAGSSVETDAQGLARQQQAQVNGLTTDITLGRERDRDALFQAAGNMGLAQGSQQLQAASGAREQHRMDEQSAYEARNAYMQNFSTILNLLNRKQAVV